VLAMIAYDYARLPPSMDTPERCADAGAGPVVKITLSIDPPTEMLGMRIQRVMLRIPSIRLTLPVMDQPVTEGPCETRAYPRSKILVARCGRVGSEPEYQTIFIKGDEVFTEGRGIVRTGKERFGRYLLPCHSRVFVAAP
jgi:hypothetical protein